MKETAPFGDSPRPRPPRAPPRGGRTFPVEPATRTAGRSCRENLLTYFNLVFLCSAVSCAVKASILNLSFIVVVIINAVIGIVQELPQPKRRSAPLHILTRRNAPSCARGRNGA